MINNKPLVSVILAVNIDNGFLESAINSILSQSYSNFELLIVANNCADELWSNIEEKARQDDRIKPYRLKLGGLSFALNFGLNIADGSYIARMDADDISVNNRLERQIEYLVENPNVDILGTHAIFIDENNKSLERICFVPQTYKKIVKVLPWKSPIIHPSVIAKKDVLLALGGYKFGLYGEDYDLWLRAWNEGYILHNLKDKLLLYRSHAKQASSHRYSKKQSVAVRSILYLHSKQTRSILLRLKYKFGMLVQTKPFFCLINLSSLFRNKLKVKSKKQL